MAVSKNLKLQPQQDPLRELVELTRRLKLSALRDGFPELLSTAEKEQQSYSDFALAMLRFEDNQRQSRRLTHNLDHSGLPQVVRSLEHFDFSIRPQLEPRVVKELLNCRYGPRASKHYLRGKTRPWQKPCPRCVYQGGMPPRLYRAQGRYR